MTNRELQYLALHGTNAEKQVIRKWLEKEVRQDDGFFKIYPAFLLILIICGIVGTVSSYLASLLIMGFILIVLLITAMTVIPIGSQYRIVVLNGKYVVERRMVLGWSDVNRVSDDFFGSMTTSFNSIEEASNEIQKRMK